MENENTLDLTGKTAEEIAAAIDNLPRDAVVSAAARIVGKRQYQPRQSAVAFVCIEPESVERRSFMAYPQALFKGEGLWLWGTDATTLVHNIKVGNQNCHSISHVAIPGLYFEAGMPFAEFEKLLETPRAEWSHEWLRELPPLKAHQRIDMITAEVGNNIILDVEGPLTHAVTWGKTVQ